MRKTDQEMLTASDEEVQAAAEASCERARQLILSYPPPLQGSDVVVLTAFCLKIYTVVHPGKSLMEAAMRAVHVAQHMVEDEALAAAIRAKGEPA